MLRRACIVALALLAAPGAAAPLPSDAVIRAGLQEFLAAAAAEGFTGAVLVARADTILLEAGYGTLVPGGSQPVTPTTVFTTGSITKQFTATAILVLQERGRLSVRDSLGEYIENVPDDKRGITLHQLLTHTAGFPGAIGDDRERVGREEYVQRALATPLAFPPGSRYEYSNVGYSLLAAVVEIVAGASYERFLHEALFVPAGMQDTGYRLPAWEPARLAHGVGDDGGDWGTVVEHAIGGDGPGWNLLGNGGIHSTVSDMFRWHRALHGESILPAAAKQALVGRYTDEGGSWYGYGWSIEDTPWGELVTHNGGNPYFFADFLRFPAADVVIYYTTSSRDRRMHRLARPLARIVFTGLVPELPASPPAAAGAAPPAAEGSLAAKWGLPGSQHGERAAELLEAITTGDAAARKKWVETIFAPALVQRRGAEGLAASLGQLRDELGEFRLLGARTQESGVVVDLETAGTPVQLELELEPEPPHRIVSLGVQKGD